MTRKERERRRKIGEASKRMWTDPVSRELRLGAIRASLADEEKEAVRRRKIGKWSKNYWKDSGFKAFMTAESRKYWAKAGSREAQRVRLQARMDDPDELAKHSKRLKKYYEIHPEVASRRAKIRWSKPGAKEEQSKRALLMWKDPEHLAMMSKVNSKRMLAYYATHPEAREVVSERILAWYREGNRPPASKKNWITTRKGGKVCYRSSWELRFIHLLEASKLVRRFVSEPFVIPFQLHKNGKVRSYFPDFLVVLKSGKKLLVVEIKSPHLMTPDRRNHHRRKFAAARVFCKEHGLTFVLIKKKLATLDCITD